MFSYCFVLFCTLASSQASNAFETLFPEKNKLYTYALASNVSSGVVAPVQDGSIWTLNGILYVQVYDEFGRARVLLDDLKIQVNSKNKTSSHQPGSEAEKYLKTPWEVDVCFSAIYVDTEPVWVTNIKRGLSYNFLLAEVNGAPSSSEEPCLYGNCVVVYSRVGSQIRKYNSLIDKRRTRLSSYEQKCLPNKSSDAWYRPSYAEDLNYVMTAERVYELGKIGLKSMVLRSDFQYKSHDHILSVATDLSLHFVSTRAVQSTQKLNLSESSMQYTQHNYSNPTNGIWETTQDQLKTKTFNMLLRIARKGIDADNIVRNASFIHSMDFIELLTTMSQLNYMSLASLFGDVLGTSYELETSRNIYLEILPYVRNDACAKLIRYLVTEQKAKIEDAVLVTLLRKLPFNLVQYSRSLLQELEVFTKLGPEYPQEIRHAGILSFATLVHKTMEAEFDQQYFDDIYDKYLRMYNYCPQYVDRLVWLQGLTNIGKSVVNYLGELHIDPNKERHERVWAALGALNIWKMSTLESTLPILMNETEHIQLRILALHSFLSSPLGARDFLNVHNYIRNCNNEQLKKFWYSTVKSLVNNQFYNRYKSASYYIPFIANQLSDPGLSHWATNNFIISQEPSLDVQGPTLQVLTAGGVWSGPPEMVLIEFSTGGDQTLNTAVYIIAEGVSSNIFKRFQDFNATERFSEQLLKEFQSMKVEILEPEKVHIDLIIKVYGKTVYATHIDQERFDTWNIEEWTKSLEDFVRFGSHINQQIVYYPIQMVMNFPTEIGTPVRMQSTIVSFTSLRGNLTAPSSTEDLTWRNDFHIRYQGTSVTSLSTDGPLQPSEHTVRIQQSMVVHLPIKFDISLSPLARSLELKWRNPVQNGGVAMHSRTQIEAKIKNATEIRTVTSKNKRKEEGGIFFDCEHPMTGPQVSQLLTSRHYNILNSLQPSLIILNSIRLVTSPTPGSCGLILPPRQLEAGNIVSLVLRIDELIWDDDDDEVGTPKDYESVMRIKVSYAFGYYRELDDNSTTNYLTVKGYSKFKSDGRNGAFLSVLNSQQPQAEDPGLRNWTICLREHHNISQATLDIDFSLQPVAYKGEISVNYSSENDFACFSKEPSSELVVQYNSTPTHQLGYPQRHVQLKVGGKNLPQLDLGTNIVEDTDWMELLKGLHAQSPEFKYFAYADIKEEKGAATVTINNTQLEFHSDLFSWLPDTWTTMQALRKLGFYHECRIQGSRVHTFSGTTTRLPSWYHETLAVGDCTDSPRFAVILSHYDRGVTVYTGGDHLTYYSPNGSTPIMRSSGDQRPKHISDFRVTSKATNERMIRSQLTGVRVRHTLNETVILIPHAYMRTACGACASQTYYNKTV